jgi:NADPH:quinone reductase-like Zn-dependent oxidoreductase
MATELALRPLPMEREVWRMPRAGSLDRLRIERETLPPAGIGEASVEVSAVGLNFADIFACLGLYSATPKGPFVPGLEFSGVVREVGPSAPDGTMVAAALRPGDQVVGVVRFGAYATALNADVRYLRPLPEGWSSTEGAAFPVQALTAWHGLHTLGGLKSGSSVLVHSAAGGVGLNALHIAVSRRARIVATVGSESKKTFLLDRFGLEPDAVVVRDRRRFGDQLDRALRAIDADGFDVVLDGVAGPYFRPALRRLRSGGRLILFGASDMTPSGAKPNYAKLAWQYLRRPNVDVLRLVNSNRAVIGFNLIWLWNRAADLAREYDEVRQVITAPPLVGCTFPFADAPAALRFLQSGKSTGKVVLEIRR